MKCSDVQENPPRRTELFSGFFQRVGSVLRTGSFRKPYCKHFDNISFGKLSLLSNSNKLCQLQSLWSYYDSKILFILMMRLIYQWYETYLYSFQYNITWLWYPTTSITFLLSFHNRGKSFPWYYSFQSFTWCHKWVYEHLHVFVDKL